MSERITAKDVHRAVEAHAACLARCGIAYAGRLVLSEGSKLYGRAWRLNLTDTPRPDGSCSSGHSRPPIGDDYLGMTAREAYDALTERTRTIYDTAHALRPDAA